MFKRLSEEKKAIRLEQARAFREKKKEQQRLLRKEQKEQRRQKVRRIDWQTQSLLTIMRAERARTQKLK